MSINKTVLVGNLTRDPELRTTQSGTAVASFTVAVQRRYKDADGNYPADFINCVAWRGTAEFIAKYFSKGSKIGIVGSLQSRSYDDSNGIRRYITEVVVDEAEFAGGKPQRDVQKLSEQEEQLVDELFSEELSDFEQIDEGQLPF